MNPSVSIVIPTYNRADFVRNAIQSAVAQTLQDIEIIVVDDGSTDHTIDVIDEFNDPRIKFKRHESNQGGNAARNTGTELADGDFIAYLDSDDVWYSDKLELQTTRLHECDDDFIVSYCDSERDRDGGIKQLLSDWIERPTGFEGGEQLIPPLLSRKFTFGGSSALLVKAEAVEEIGGWDEDFPRNQDMDFLVRLLEIGKLAYVNKELLRHFDTGQPALENVKIAEKLLLKKHEGWVTYAESQGYDPYGVSNFFLAKHKFREADLIGGFHSLRHSKCPHIRDFFGLGASIISGMFQGQ